MVEGVRVMLLTFVLRAVTQGDESSAGYGMVRLTSFPMSWMPFQLKHKCVYCAELEDRLRATQSSRGSGILSAQAMLTHSRGAEGVTEQPLRFPSDP